jgi:hypothetical protein
LCVAGVALDRGIRIEEELDWIGLDWIGLDGVVDGSAELPFLLRLRD